MVRMARSSLFVFLIALALGLGGGLYLGWVAWPPQAAGSAPAALHQAAKDEVILMTATAYAGDQNLAAARARLTELGFRDPGPAIVAAAQRARQAGAPEADLRRLAQLAAAFDTFSPILEPYLP